MNQREIEDAYRKRRKQEGAPAVNFRGLLISQKRRVIQTMQWESNHSLPGIRGRNGKKTVLVKMSKYAEY